MILDQINERWHAEDVAQLALSHETDLLTKLRVQQNLTRTVSLPGGAAAFASAFYFIRYNFYKVNFIVGSRSGPHEATWAGLVRNLHEELGGDAGVSHNELYRRFLDEVGIPNETNLTQPDFALKFNETWETHCLMAPFDEALAAVAIYEILDQPDYQMLLDVMKGGGLSPQALTFFEVHAKADHFQLFAETMRALLQTQSGCSSVSRALAFVTSSQDEMWTGLLHHLN